MKTHLEILQEINTSLKLKATSTICVPNLANKKIIFDFADIEKMKKEDLGMYVSI